MDLGVSRCWVDCTKRASGDGEMKETKDRGDN